MEIVYIGIGSNQGNRRANIDLARYLIARRGVKILQVSPLYESEAVTRHPGESAPPYLNGVLKAETGLDPEALLITLEEIEQLVGRRTKGDWAPRPIDLDILLYGDRVIKTERLTIPHPELTKRWFVLRPLRDLGHAIFH